MVKPDFFSNPLMNVPLNDLLSAIKILESQNSLVEELK